MLNFGGEMTFALSTGDRIVVRAAAEIMPPNVDVTSAGDGIQHAYSHWRLGPPEYGW